MTNFFIKLFVPNYKNSQDPAVRAKVGRLSGTVGIIGNGVLFAAKLLVGILSGSVAVTADAMNNLSDAASSIVTLVGFKLAEKPADSEHPYGHARFEYLSALAVAVMILFIGFELAKSAVMKIIEPAAVSLTVPMLLALGLSVLIKLWLCLLNRGLGKHIGSQALMAAAADSRNDIIATGAVLVAALIETWFSVPVDGFMGFGVAVFILYSGITMAKQTVSPLLGEAASPELRHCIAETVSAHPLVLGYHDLMVHDYGPGKRFASIHVEMDQREDPLVCHEIIDEMERKCLDRHNVHLVIHYDPVITDDPQLAAMREQVVSILQQMDSRLSVHDFRMVKGLKNSNLIFDIATPQELMDKKQQIKDQLESALAERNQGTYHTVITFDPEEFNACGT